MAVSVKLYGDTFNYTVSNITNALTFTAANRNQRYGALYTKPTVTQNTKGAHTRYIWLVAAWSNSSDTMYQNTAILATYQAVWNSSSTTATVTEISTNKAMPMGETYVNHCEYIPSGYTARKIAVVISTSNNISNSFDENYVALTYSCSGWTPLAPTISYSLRQTLNKSVFGYVKGFCYASWNAITVWGQEGGSLWTYSLNGFSGTIYPKNTLAFSANGASGNTTALGQISVSLSEKLINATSVTATAKLTNNLGGSVTATKTFTCQDYSAPTISNLTIKRVTENSQDNCAQISFNWIVNSLNQSSSEGSVTSGNISATWSIVDKNDPSFTASGTEYIVEDTETLSVLSDNMQFIDDEHATYVKNYDPEHSYTLSLYITDRLGRSSSTLTAVLPPEFRTMDFSAGGKGVALGTIAEDGKFKVSNELRPQLSGIMSQGLGTCWSAAMEDAPYGRNNVAYGVGSDGNNKGIWCSEYNGVAAHWMIKEGADGEAILNKFFPVGSVVITYTNSSPASRFGGSWSLFDKEYKYSWVSSGFTFNTTNTTEGTFVALCTGKAVEIRLTWKNKVAISDDTKAIGTMNMSNIGMSAVHTSYGVTWNDALGGIGMVRFAWSDGVLTVYVDDWTTRATSYPTTTGQWCYLSAVILAQGTSMTDSFCDKFYWRRTA